MGALALAAAAVVIHLALLALRTRSDLNDARARLDRLLANHQPLGSADRSRLVSETRNARDATNTWDWRLMHHAPWIGSSFAAATRVSTIADAVVVETLPDDSAITSDIQPARLRPTGQLISVATVEDLQRRMARVAPILATLNVQMQSMHHARTLPFLGGRVAKLQHDFSRAATAARTANRVLPALPALLGAEGSRNYFVAVQNLAESRGTGGLLGAFATISVDRGRIAVGPLGPDSELSPFGGPGGTLPDLHRLARYGPLTAANDTGYHTANSAPDFPSGAQRWAHLYAAQSGMRIDGVIAIDSQTMADLLEATGPVHLPDGTQVTSKNVVPLTLSTNYQSFNGKANSARKDYLQQVGKAVLDAALHTTPSIRKLATAMSAANSLRHIQMWSPVPAEESAFTALGVDGRFPTADNETALVFNNAGGTKLDYYLQRTISSSTTSCEPTNKATQGVDVTVTNTAPASGLPPYVDRHDLPPGAHVIVGQHIASIGYYVPPYATLVAYTVDGKTATPTMAEQYGRPVFITTLVLDPGQTRHVRLVVNEPAQTGPTRLWRQATVRPEKLSSTFTNRC